MKKILLFLADGFEEVEAVTPIDFLRRAGIEVTTVGVGGRNITAAHGLRVVADKALDEIGDPDSYDGLVLPGGLPGAENLAAEKRILELIESFNDGNKTIAAICASPGVVFTKTNVLEGKTATCYPGFEKYFGSATTFTDKRVVKDDNIITSRGPGTAAEFSIELIKHLADAETAENIKNATIQLF